MKNLNKKILLLFVSICCGVNVAYSQTKAISLREEIYATRDVLTETLINNSNLPIIKKYNDAWVVKVNTSIRIQDQIIDGILVHRPSNNYSNLNLKYHAAFGFSNWYDFGIINHNYFADWSQSKNTNRNWDVFIPAKSKVTFKITTQDIALSYQIVDNNYGGAILSERIINGNHKFKVIKTEPLVGNARMESENFDDAEESAFPENGTELTGVTTAFPNPVKDILNLTNVSSTATISILDVNGKEVMNAIGQSQLNIGSLDAGMYFVRVNGDKPIKITKE